MRDGFGNLSDGGTQPTQPTQLTRSPQPTQSTQSTQPAQSNGDTGLTTATKAGIVVALIGGILLGLLGALAISRWRRRKKSKAQAETSDPVGWAEGGNSTAQILETRQCESES